MKNKKRMRWCALIINHWWPKAVSRQHKQFSGVSVCYRRGVAWLLNPLCCLHLSVCQWWCCGTLPCPLFTSLFPFGNAMGHWWDTALPSLHLSFSFGYVMGHCTALSSPLFFPLVMPWDTALPSLHLSFSFGYAMGHCTALSSPLFFLWLCHGTLHYPLFTSLFPLVMPWDTALPSLHLSFSFGYAMGHCSVLSSPLFFPLVMPWDTALPSLHLSFSFGYVVGHCTALSSPLFFPLVMPWDTALPSLHLSFSLWLCHGSLHCPLFTSLFPFGYAMGVCTALSSPLFFPLVMPWESVLSSHLFFSLVMPWDTGGTLHCPLFTSLFPLVMPWDTSLPSLHLSFSR